MPHQLPKHAVSILGGRGVDTFLSYRPEGRVGSCSNRQRVCSRVKDRLTSSEIHLQGWDRSVSSQSCYDGMHLPAPQQSLPHIPQLCRVAATEAGDERRGMQTSEKPGRLCLKENTANSLLIIQTSGLPLFSSWGFKQEALLRMSGERGGCPPEPEGASSPP